MARTAWAIAAAIAASVILVFADDIARRRPVVEIDERPGAYQAPRRVLARIQSDLERVGAGGFLRPLPLGEPRDPLEQVVQAYDAFLRGRVPLLRDHVAAIRAEAITRLGRDQPSIAANTPPLVALIRAMRLASAALSIDPSQTLRLPCSTVIGRAAAFTEAATALGEADGPLTSCPVIAGTDFATQERLARDPARLAEAFRPAPPPPAPDFGERFPSPPWSRDAALRYMGDNPDAAEPALRMAALDDLVGKLDLALFLHAFREPGPERDSEIRSLMATIDRAAQAKATDQMRRRAGDPRPYDGSDESLVPSLLLAGYTEVASLASGAELYPYPIPCAVWQHRPGLEAALGGGIAVTPEDGQVNFRPPIAGCLISRGRVAGFPEADFAAFLNIAGEGAGTGNRAKTPRYPLRLVDTERMAQILYRPRDLLAAPPPTQDLPFRTWSYATLGHRDTFLRLQPLFERAKTSLIVWFKTKGLDETEAAEAATRALVQSAYGADCGGAMPPASIRKMVMDGAAAETLARQLVQPTGDLTPFAECAKETPFDPLVLVAVGNPAALPLLWDAAATASAESDPEGLGAVRRVNTRNAFGKTALMAAAEADQLESVRFLLDHGARVNADTWQTGGSKTMDRDFRTALMYAAANASLPVIKALLAAGADPRQTDSAGLRPIHYLLGAGLGAPNPRLSPADRTAPARLLF